MGIFKDRTGEVIFNSEEDVKKKGWYKMEIVAYRSATDMDVLIDDKYLLTGQRYGNFIRRNIKNPYHRSVYGMGYIGEGKYAARDDSIYYCTWRTMIRNCCKGTRTSKILPPSDCAVIEEWHNFQTFAAWMKPNYYRLDNERVVLNKGILLKGNELYSDKFCIFVPHKIHHLVKRGKGTLGGIPTGVTMLKNGRFQAGHGKTYIATFSTQTKAFRAFKLAKEARIRRAIDSYCGKIPEPHYTKLRDALYAYEISFDD